MAWTNPRSTLLANAIATRKALRPGALLQTDTPLKVDPLLAPVGAHSKSGTPPLPGGYTAQVVVRSLLAPVWTKPWTRAQGLLSPQHPKGNFGPAPRCSSSTGTRRQLLMDAHSEREGRGEHVGGM